MVPVVLFFLLPFGNAIDQPAAVFCAEGSNVTLNCAQKGTNYNTMYWFLQKPSGEMDLIVYFYVKMETMEDHWKEKFIANRKDATMSLTLREAQMSDIGVYFRAKVHTHSAIASSAAMTETAGFCLEVRQSPSLLWKTQGLDESAEMKCEHTDVSFYQMYWFRQIPGQSIELVVLSDTTNKPDFGSFSSDKYGVVKTVVQKGNFTVKKLAPEDSGIYFCAAASHEVSAHVEHIMITRAFINFLILLFWNAGHTAGGSVEQFPSSLLLRSGELATLSCSHSVPSYNTVLWYRQSGGIGSLELLGYLYHENENLEPLMEKRIRGCA
ncbi:hypothetical protein GJAV_G00003710 [Gymnothorax javanicus]|nr:hypothetical protein GJAV_G00003710 [Gymnothorax javanicus]